MSVSTGKDERSPTPRGVAAIGGHSLVYALSSLFGQLGTLFTFPLYTRALGRVEYGVLALLLSASGVVRTLVIAGVNTSLMHVRVKTDERHAARATTAACLWVLGAATGVWVCLVALRPWVGDVFGLDLPGRLILAVTVFVAADSLYEMMLATARAEARAGSYAYSNVIRVIATLVAAVALLLVVRAGAAGAVWGMAVGSAAAAVWLARTLRFRPVLRGAFTEIPGLLRSGVPLVPANLASWISNLSDRYLLLLLGGTTATVGLYSAGYRLGSLITTLYVGPFHTAFLPLMLKSGGEREEVQTYREASRVFLILGSVAVLVLQASAVPAVFLLAGSAFAGSERVVGIVAFGCLLAGAAMLMTPSALKSERPHLLSLAFGAGAAANVAINLLLIPVMGMIGAAVATLVGYAIVLFAMLLLTVPEERPPGLGATLVRLLPVMTGVTLPTALDFGSPWEQGFAAVALSALGIGLLTASGTMGREDLNLLGAVVSSAARRVGDRLVPRSGRLGPQIRHVVRSALALPRALQTLSVVTARSFAGMGREACGRCTDPPYLAFLRANPSELERAVKGVERIVDGEMMTFGRLWKWRGGRDWHLDPLSGRRWPLVPAPFIDVNWVVGDSDIQCVWETSRLEHLWRVALEYVRSRDERQAEWVVRQLRSWLRWNPVGWGVNWTVTMEVALRAIALVEIRAALIESECWTAAFDRRVCRLIAQHAEWTADNLEHRGVGTQNHYLASLVGLLSVASHLPDWKRLQEQLEWIFPAFLEAVESQVTPDGVDFENSLGYHLLVSELVAHAIADCRTMGLKPSDLVLNRASAMLGFARLMEFADGTPVAFGDDDDDFVAPNAAEYFAAGRPQLAARLAYALHTLGDVVPGTPASPPLCFPDAGVYLLGGDRVRAFVNVMPTGVRGTGPHRHNDALSFCLEVCGRPVFVDPGTYRYQSSHGERDRYRSVAAHNTVQVDGLEQNDFVGPFALARDRIKLSDVTFAHENQIQSVSAAHSGFKEGAGLVHWRTWEYIEPDETMIVVDTFKTVHDDWLVEMHEFISRLHVAPGLEVKLSRRGEGSFYLSVGCCTATFVVEGAVDVTGRVAPSTYSPYYRCEIPSETVEIRWKGTAQSRLVSQFSYVRKSDL